MPEELVEENCSSESQNPDSFEVLLKSVPGSLI
jgi:hypothetical protein